MNWEIKILQMLQESRSVAMTALMEAISFMAESLFLVMILATLYWCIDKKRTVRIGWLLLCSGVTNGLLKNVIRAPRPFEKGVVSPIRIETATSYAFPSGHVQSATSFWGTSMMLFRSRSVMIIGCIMIGLTAYSRMYLGVHWPTDVIAGIVVGSLSIILADKLYDEEQGFTNWHVLGVGILVLVLTILPVDKDLASIAGTIWGFVVGSYIEKKYIGFTTKGDWKVQLKKLLIGFGGLIALYLLMNSWIEGVILLSLIKHAILLLWLSAGAPYIFKRYIIK